jgi:hypothetical protein
MQVMVMLEFWFSHDVEFFSTTNIQAKSSSWAALSVSAIDSDNSLISIHKYTVTYCKPGVLPNKWEFFWSVDRFTLAHVQDTPTVFGCLEVNKFWRHADISYVVDRLLDSPHLLKVLSVNDDGFLASSSNNKSLTRREHHTLSIHVYDKLRSFFAQI